MKNGIKVLTIVLMFATVATAAQLHVDRYLNWPGAYRTPKAAYLAASDYDEIIIHSGVYPSAEWPAMDKAMDYGDPNGAAGDPNDYPVLAADGVTFKAYQNPANPLGQYDKVVSFDKKHYIRYRQALHFDGILFQGTRGSDDAAQYALYFRTPGVDSIPSSGHEITNCVFDGNEDRQIYGYGADTSTWIANVVIDNCTFEYTRDSDAIRLYKTCMGWTIQDSIFLDNDGKGVYARNPEDRVYVDNSLFDNCNSGYTYDPNDPPDETGWPVNGSPYGDGYAHIGTGCIINTLRPVFQSNTQTDNTCYYLDASTDSSILTGSSTGGYMGARPVPEPVTIVLIAMGGLLALYRRR